MARRRKISLGGCPIQQADAEVARVRDAMRARFKDAKYLDRFLDILVRTGWTSLDIDRTVQAYDNTDRPELQVALEGNHAPLISLLQQQQGQYTSGLDTVADPNIAIRFPGETELMFRRMTPSAHILSLAAHSLNVHEYDIPFERYWMHLWEHLLYVLFPYDHIEVDAMPSTTFFRTCMHMAISNDTTVPELQAATDLGNGPLVVFSRERVRALNSNGTWSQNYVNGYRVSVREGVATGDLYRVRIECLAVLLDRLYGHLGSGSTPLVSFAFAWKEANIGQASIPEPPPEDTPEYARDPDASPRVLSPAPEQPVVRPALAELVQGQPALYSTALRIIEAMMEPSAFMEGISVGNRSDDDGIRTEDQSPEGTDSSGGPESTG